MPQTPYLQLSWAEIALISRPPPTQDSILELKFNYSNYFYYLILVLFIYCSWLVHYLFIVHDLFMTCACLAHGLIMASSYISFLNVFMTCSRVIIGLFMTWHGLLMACSWLPYDLILLTCSKIVHNLLMTCSLLVNELFMLKS